jgi:poly(ADP-ribose) glycohydrolase ARH3
VSSVNRPTRQGAVLQTLAVAAATASGEAVPAAFLRPLRAGLARFSDLMQDTSRFARALDSVERGLARGASCGEMSSCLGTGVAAHEAVPMALYCFLRHPHSYAEVIHQAVFIGGDTDTIASMAGALSGALLGRQAIPEHWLLAVRDERYSTAVIADLADRLFTRFGTPPGLS